MIRVPIKEEGAVFKMKRMGAVLIVWQNIYRIVMKYPATCIPFIVMAIFDVIVLFALFMVPRYPLSVVAAPVIRAFWGEQYLHYPANIVLLPQLFSYAKNISGVAIGIVFTGIAIGMFAQATGGTRPLVKYALQCTARKYIHLVILCVLSLLCMFAVIKGIGYVKPYVQSQGIFAVLGYGVTVIVQILFVFSIPYAVIKNQNAADALKSSVRLAVHRFAETFILVAIPNILIFPMFYLYIKIMKVFGEAFPEAVIAALIMKIIVLMIVDFLITASATLLLTENDIKKVSI